jgi:hypothetical protein
MSWTHLEDRRPIARKEHKCHLCQLPIYPGDSHVLRSGVYDGEFSSFRMHAACERLTAEWDQDTWDSFEPGPAFRGYFLEAQ